MKIAFIQAISFMVRKETIKRWLKESGRSRQWLGEQCGVSKKTVDNWLSSPQAIPLAASSLIARLMAAQPPVQISQTLLLRVDEDTFIRWSRAALARGQIVTDWALSVLESAAEADLGAVAASGDHSD